MYLAHAVGPFRRSHQGEIVQRLCGCGRGGPERAYQEGAIQHTADRVASTPAPSRIAQRPGRVEEGRDTSEKKNGPRKGPFEEDAVPINAAERAGAGEEEERPEAVVLAVAAEECCCVQERCHHPG